MITVTDAAKRQILVASKEANCEGLALRIAIGKVKKADTQKEDWQYQMGFDENTMNGDTIIDLETIKVVIDGESQVLAKGMTLDFVDINNTTEFIFLNPNDPAYVPPIE